MDISKHLDQNQFNLSKFLGENLKIIRMDRELTQSQASKLLSVGQAALSQYERGSKTPPIQFLVNFSEKFNVSIDWLVGIGNVQKINPPLEQERLRYDEIAELLHRFDDIKSVVVNEDFPHSATFTFNDPIMAYLVKSWISISDSYYDGLIDKSIYDAWKEKISFDFDRFMLNDTDISKALERISELENVSYEEITKLVNELESWRE